MAEDGKTQEPDPLDIIKEWGNHSRKLGKGEFQTILAKHKQRRAERKKAKEQA